jgi:predicted secreted hydrolase
MIIAMPRLSLLLVLLAIGAALALTACSGTEPTPTPVVPTPTPPYGLPPLTLPADEAPHDFQTEWWYFNAHLTGEEGQRFALHDVVFQVQQLDSGRTLYVRQVGLASVESGSHASAERLRSAEAPLPGSADGFAIALGDTLLAGEGGTSYRMVGGAGGTTYDLTLIDAGEPLVHDDDGLVDFGPAGVTYYYSRPRLEAAGTVTTSDGTTISVTGLAWLDKQWGNFQPVAVNWDWASVQLDDGTDLMLSRLFYGDAEPSSVYATLRLPGGETRKLGPDDFVFEPLDATWTSERTGTTYRTRWRVSIPSADLAFVLEPLVVASEFVSSVLGVAYWETGADVVDADGERIGQGFVELNWPRGSSRPLD